MQAGPPQRSHPERALKDVPAARFGQVRATGDFTPEISPLDQFIYSGSMLQRELQHTTQPDGPPDQRIHKNSGARSALARRHQGIDEEREYQASIYDIAATANSISTDRRPLTINYPRFSTVTEDGYRDSMVSDRDSTIMGGFSVGFGFDRSMPDLHQSAQSKNVQQGFTTGRDSVRPTISNIGIEEEIQMAHVSSGILWNGDSAWDPVGPVISSFEKEEPISPTSEATARPSIPHTAITAPSPKALSHLTVLQRDELSSRGQDGSHGVGYEPTGYLRSQSQIGDGRPRAQPSCQRSGDDIRALQDSRSHDERQYLPYRKDSSQAASPVTQEPILTRSEQFSPPSRQSSGHSDRVLPYRQGSASSDRRYNAPLRQGSEEFENRYIPCREGSRDSVQNDHSQQSAEDSRHVSRNSPLPQLHPFLHTTQHVRAVSPESMSSRSYREADQLRSLGSPTLNTPHPSPLLNSSYMERSPSAASDVVSIHSVGGTKLYKQTLNFSRPLSHRPSMDSQHRPSIDIPPNTPMTAGMQFDHLPTPTSFTEEPMEISENGSAPAPSYIYSRFILPRGRSVERDSLVFQDSHPMLESIQQHSSGHPQNSQNATGAMHAVVNNSPSPNMNYKGAYTRHDSTKQSKQSAFAENTLLAPQNSCTLAITKPITPKDTPKSPIAPNVIPAASMTPDQHLDVGIDLHEKGSLQESTYHLRCAAHSGHPTGMLLYALACRHGWGMRPNQKEGVSWLKKVTQIASSDVADIEKNNKGAAFIEKQAHRAQFALSIYELGISHLNGWGTEMDKGLALNCFEIAGKWGDPDALSECGFCYANAVGCKKDLKKAAKYYRMAEAKGVNMVGNSWIWKDKYLNDDDRALKNNKLGKLVETTSKKDVGGSIFSRKKSTT